MPICTPEWTYEEAQEMSEILLRRLGFSGKLFGFQYLSAATAKAIISPDKVLFVTKEIYPEVAKEYGSTASGVERSMRHSIRKFWEQGGREALDQMADIHLLQRPTNSELIDLLASYIRHNH